jgi:RNA polymerase subunit RPABC4/transcription elongation factor Spt4
MNIWVEMHAFGNGILRSVNVPNGDIIDAARTAGVGIDEMIANTSDRLGLEVASRVLAERLACTHDAVKLALCALTFHWGQNDFQPQHMPSVSVGDVIRVPIDRQGCTVCERGIPSGYDVCPSCGGEGFRRFAVTNGGFREIAKDFDVPHDGGMWAYAL